MKFNYLFLGLVIAGIFGTQTPVFAQANPPQNYNQAVSGTPSQTDATYDDVVNLNGGDLEGSAPDSPDLEGSSPTQPVKNIPTLKNPLRVDSVESLLFTVVDVAIFLGVIIAVFVFVFIGFKFVMAQGNDDALSDAKRWFMYAVIGTAILLGAKVIVSVIQNTLTSAGVVNEDLFKKK